MKRFKYLTLAALVAIAACDEGTDTPVAPPVTGTISGVVTIEASGASGVTVTLSSGATATTGSNGAYSFQGVAAGAYTVTISGFASDATFTSTAKAATISTQGQVATVDFSGSFIRTSAILGSVSVGGAGLGNVAVAISGQSSASTTTNTNGQFSFSGLRAGSYTVTMTNPSATTYTFPSTTSSVTLTAGASQVVSFSGSLLATARVAGRLFIDENAKNDNYDGSLLEANLAVANVRIKLEGGLVNDTLIAQTAADGTYEFTGLKAGAYRVTIDDKDADIPTNVAFGGTSNTVIVSVATGTTGTVNWPFDIKVQAIRVGAFLGTDGSNAMTNPIKDWSIDLYDTQANATAAGATGRIGTGKTGSDGWITFRFDRSKDVGPNGTTDRVVFARSVTVPANHSVSGETLLEINYPATDSSHTGNDVFDALNTRMVVEINAKDASGKNLSNWATALWRQDTTAATEQVVFSNTSGKTRFTVNTAVAALPDTFYIRLSGTQAGANGHAFSQAATADQGTVRNGWYLRFVHDGLKATADTLRVGTHTVTYKDQDVTVRMHHEADDSTAVPVYTGGDNFDGVGSTAVQLYRVNADNTLTSVRGPSTPTAGTGWVTWFNVPTGNYVVRARSTATFVDVLNDTTVSRTLNGASQVDTVTTLKGNKGISTFAMKYDNTAITGTVQSKDGTSKAQGIRVRIQATADNIQPDAGKDTTVKTTAAGTFSVAGLREGPYSVTVSDSATATAAVWTFFDTLKTTSTPLSAGSANNTDARTGVRDVQGPGNVKTANFQVHRMDTQIRGVVVNDRDADKNTLDPEEALSGVTINLIDDKDKDGVIDTGEPVLTTATTDANGAYSFTALKEGNYIVQAANPGNATVLRSLSGAGAVTQHVGVKTTASNAACALANCTNQNNTRTVGNTSPPGQLDELPRWNYTASAAAADAGGLGAGPNSANAASTIAPTHFIHLFSTGTVKGRVITNAGSVGVAGMRVTITRCTTAPSADTPPVAGACTTTNTAGSPWIKNTDTDASGNYTFSNLLEGVYQIEIAPQTAGYTTINTPAGGRYRGTLQGNNDIETVPDFKVS